MVFQLKKLACSLFTKAAYSTIPRGIRAMYVLRKEAQVLLEEGEVSEDRNMAI